MLIASSCTAPYYHIQTSFQLRLARVDPPGWINRPNVESDSAIFEFYDEFTRFRWEAGGDNRIDFVLDNLTADTLRVMWEDARFIDERLDSHRVLHAGVKLSARQEPRSMVMIPPKGKLVDFILPEHLIVENPARPEEVLREEPLLEVRDSSPRRMRHDARALRGHTLQVILPLRTADETKSYRFVFQIDRVTIR